MTRATLLPSVFFVLLLAPLAVAGPPQAFLERARTYHAEDHERLPALRAELAREVPDLFEAPLPACPLRSALAKAFAPAEARALIDGTLGDVDRLAVVVDNLSARRDLGALVLASGAFGRLEAAAPRLLVEVAVNALLDGDDGLVRRLLEGPAFERTADALTCLAHPEGIRTLADAVTGSLPISEAARACLATFEPNVQNERTTRPLGPERVDALLRTAISDEDPAIRALAVRLLLYANDPAFAEETVRAFVESRTAHLVDQDWHFLGKLTPVLITDDRLAIADRLALFESWFLWTWVRAYEDPTGAEALARRLRLELAPAEPRFRGEAIVMLFDHDTIFVTTTHGRKRPVPSMLGILDDLEAGRPADPPALTALGREAAARLRAIFAEEGGYPEVRLEERPLATEAAWRPAPTEVDTAFAGVVEGIDGVEAFERALRFVEDPTLPPSSRLALFGRLQRIAREGAPLSPGEDDEGRPFDRGYFERLARWLEEKAGALDGGLAELTIAAFLEGAPDDEEAAARAAFERAVDTVRAAGPRRRLEALHAKTREQR